MELESHQDVSHCGVVTGPLRKSLIVSEERWGVDGIHKVGYAQSPLSQTLEEVEHCLIILHHHWEALEDGPSLELPVNLLVVIGMLTWKWGELIRCKVC